MDLVTTASCPGAMPQASMSIAFGEKNLRHVWLISRVKKTIWPTAMVIMALVSIVAPEGLSMPIIGVKQ